MDFETKLSLLEAAKSLYESELEKELSINEDSSELAGLVGIGALIAAYAGACLGIAFIAKFSERKQQKRIAQHSSQVTRSEWNEAMDTLNDYAKSLSNDPPKIIKAYKDAGAIDFLKDIPLAYKTSSGTSNGNYIGSGKPFYPRIMLLKLNFSEMAEYLGKRQQLEAGSFDRYRDFIAGEMDKIADAIVTSYNSFVKGSKNDVLEMFTPRMFQEKDNIRVGYLGIASNNNLILSDSKYIK